MQASSVITWRLYNGKAI